MIESIKWNTLTPDERDHIVAEKVMGWQAKTCDGEMGELPTSSDGWFCQSCGYSGYWGDGFEHEEIPDRYTRSLDIAWKIVVKLKGVVLDASYKHDMLLCRATFVTMSSEYQAYGTTMPEAICIAALRTSGFEVVL